MREKLRVTTDELVSLGERRETTQEQRMLLTTLSQNINLIVRDAINGSYLHPFFDSVDMDAPITDGTNVRRFRALIQELNRTFAENIRLRGEKFKPSESVLCHTDQNETSETDNSYDGLPEPQGLTSDEFLCWVKKVMLRCRGHELPGSINPEVTSHLFREQSESWKEFSEDHVLQVSAMCKSFMQQVLEDTAPAEFMKPLEDLVINVVLEDTLKDGQRELEKLLEDKMRPPSTYNHYYTDNVQKRRQDKYEAFTRAARKKATAKAAKSDPNTTPKIILDHDLFQKGMIKSVQRDMEIFGAEETLEGARAYYKVHCIPSTMPPSLMLRRMR
jgi:hypothetical protein